MTAEIVIMNKSAVAMAADSAVTIRDENARGKIFNTANKVFSLSKYAPVGIMVSGDNSIMGVPWETVIKQFREELSTTRCDTIDEYCEKFFSFVDMFPFEEEAKEQHMLQVASFLFNDLEEYLDYWVDDRISEKGAVTDIEILDHLRSQIEKASLSFVNQSADIGILNEDTLNQIHNQYRNELNNLIDAFFEKYALSEENKNQLCHIAIHAANVGPRASGIVIAGFGEKEYYPRCRHHEVAGVVSGKTIRFENMTGHCDVRTDLTAAILPFAQSNEVATFMRGISPSLSEVIEEALRDVFGEEGDLPRKMSDALVSVLGLQQVDHSDFKKILGHICQGAYEGAIETFRKESRERHIDPILATTAVLNKDELARMAETFVNLESFRQQVVLDEETVGGPIDVAIITKGDGLIWIKRKHYFRPELNHHFFKNYFRNYPYTTLQGEQHEHINQ